MSVRLLALVLVCAVGTAPAAWELVGPGGGGWIQSLCASRHTKDLLYVGSDVGGFYRSEDGGGHYEICNTGLGNLFVEDIAEHPTDPKVILLGTAGGIYKSTDGGRTWAEKRTGFPPIAANRRTVEISKVVYDPLDARIVYASVGSPRHDRCRRSEIYKSEDGGESWRQIVPAGALPDKISINDLVVWGKGRLLISTPKGLFRSGSDGARWDPVVDGLPVDAQPRRLAVSRANPRIVYVTLRQVPGREPWQAGVYRSEDAGKTWAERNDGFMDRQRVTGKKGANVMSVTWTDRIVVNPKDADDVWIAGGSWWCQGVWRTTDGGKRWKSVWTGKDQSGWLSKIGACVTAMTFSPVDGSVAFGNSSTIYRTTDGGTSWSPRYAETLEDGAVRGCGLEILCVHSIQASRHQKGRFWMNNFDVGLFRVEDFGRRLYHSMKDVPRYADTFRIAEDPSDENHLWASFGYWSGNNGWIAESHDLGRTWKRLDAKESGWKSGTPWAFAGNARVLLAVTGGKQLQVSRDNGTSWSCIGTNVFAAAERVSFLTMHDGRVYAGTKAVGGELGEIWKSDDLGVSWRRIGEGVGFGTVYDMDFSNGQIAVATRHGWSKTKGAGEGGVWLSPDNGKSWTLKRRSMFCSAVRFSPRGLVAGFCDHPYHDRCIGEGVWLSPDGGATWQSMNDKSLGNQNINTIAVDGFSGRIMVGTGGNSAFVTE